jgi:hypothetical protein
MKYCNHCGQAHDTTGCPPRHTPVPPSPAWGTPVPPSPAWCTLEPRLTLIPSDFLQDGQRIPVHDGTVVVSRAEYNRIRASLAMKG